ncbi:hypothetical protein OIDMADRAFT_62392 [Oidiodendron maius Zn]|uniref:Uncharacterized protein n=1 Tax=Oidiodendron maius (strain Zn) TaxID=913774 RepID=A0A0C3G8W3_OIDMZ|nr:hypothetical protein OIDMADRAFT_62392 [Oidiodendron maius Zn]
MGDEFEEDVTDAIDRSSANRNSVPPCSDSNYNSPYVSNSVNLNTPPLALTPSSSFASPNKRLATPPPALELDRIPNIQYFQVQWVYIENLGRLDPKLSWEPINGTRTKWLVYNDSGDLYDAESPGPLGIILLDQLGPFVRLRSAENNFNKNRPEFSLQLEIGEQPLGILKNLVRRRERNLTVVNPLRIKVAESDITFSSFTPGGPFPSAFDGTSTDDDRDGDTIDASCFTTGDKVAIQAWFGTYVFTDKSGKTASGPTFRLPKLWRLQAGISTPSSVNNSPVTKRKRLF